MLEVLRSGSCRSGRCCRSSSAPSPPRLGAAHASAVSSGTAGLHLALRAVGVSDGDEVVTSPFSFVASANAIVYERAAPGVRRHRSGHAQPRPRRGRGRGHRAHGRAAAGARLRLPGRPPRVRGACGCRSSRTPARRSAPCTPTASPVGARGHPAVFGFYANKQLTTGEGGMVSVGGRRDQGSGSTPSATRAGRPTWAGSTTTGSASTTACRTSPARSGSPSSSASTRCWPPAPTSPSCTARRWPGSRGSSCPAPTPAATAAAGSCSSCSCPRGVDRDDTVRALAEHGVQSKPYFPAIHLMSFYRERFGHREGEFPVCEDVAARSIALPFFPGLTEGQVARVAADAARGAGPRVGCRSTAASARCHSGRHVPLRRAPGRRLPAPERLDRASTGA